MEQRFWLIVGTTDNETDPETGERLYWSEEDGWVSRDTASSYLEPVGALPIGGEWEKMD